LYELSPEDDREILRFYRTPDATGDTDVTFPHLHIGRAVIGGQAAIRPRDLHKAHIPTGRVALPAIVRLAIGPDRTGRRFWSRSSPVLE
jgi:hypothetical protein